MPTKRRRMRRPVMTGDLTKDQERDLVWGRGRSAFSTDKARRDCWAKNRAGLIDRLIARHPGYRPDAWWEYESPTPRLCRTLGHEAPRFLYEAGLLTTKEQAVWVAKWKAEEQQAYRSAREDAYCLEAPRQLARSYFRYCRNIPKALRRKIPGASKAAIALGEPLEGPRDVHVLTEEWPP